MTMSLASLLVAILCLIAAIQAHDLRNEVIRSRRQALSTLTAEEREQLLDDHNMYRSLESTAGSGQGDKVASNMKLMLGVDVPYKLGGSSTSVHKLADFAAELGDLKENQADCIKETDENGELVGQNLAIIPPDVHPDFALKLWYDEKPEYNFYKRKCLHGECGHYLQMVFSESTRVGCAYTKCENLHGGNLVVCDYFPLHYQSMAPYILDDTPCPHCNRYPAWKCNDDTQSLCATCDSADEPGCVPYDESKCQTQQPYMPDWVCDWYVAQNYCSIMSIVYYCGLSCNICIAKELFD